jgi:hypothetical protein
VTRAFRAEKTFTADGNRALEERRLPNGERGETPINRAAASDG